MQLSLADGLLSGRYSGMYVEAQTLVARKSRQTHLSVRFDRPLGLGLSMSRQGSNSGIKKLLGYQDIEVGDADFDARFVVKGAPVSAVKAVLTPELRARLIQLQDSCHTLTIKDDSLQAEVHGLIADADHLEAALSALAQVGAALAQVGQIEAGAYRGAS